MSEKHTPGPWEVRKISRDGQQFIGQKGSMTNVARVLGGFTLGDPARDLLDANARLIAAAPDLLRAVEEFLAEIGPDGFNTDGYPESLAVKWMREAIARATGGDHE